MIHYDMNVENEKNAVPNCFLGGPSGDATYELGAIAFPLTEALHEFRLHCSSNSIS